MVHDLVELANCIYLACLSYMTVVSFHFDCCFIELQPFQKLIPMISRQKEENS